MAKIQKKIETTIPFNFIFLFSTQRLSIREPPNYLPTEATEPTEVSGARYSPTDCTDVHRLGGYGILPYPPTKTPTDCTDAHRLGEYGIPAIPSYENFHRLHGCAQIRRVWHPCHTHAATKLSSHRIRGTHRNDWRRRKICFLC